MKINKTNRSLCNLIFCGLLASACSSTSQNAQHAQDPMKSASPVAEDNSKAVTSSLRKRPKDEVAPGFSFKIAHPEDRQLKGLFRIEKGGLLRLPYQKTINTTGMKLEELEHKIVDVYKPFFQKGPDVSVQLSDRKLWIDVQGPVGKPGPVLINEEASLDEVLASCDGNNASAQIRYASVTQDARNEVFNIEQQHRVGTEPIRPLWRGAEVVVFSRESLANVQSANSLPSVKLLGEVKKPGDYALATGRDFYHFLTEAEGYATTADPEKIELLRGKDHERTMINFNALNPSSVPSLQAGDVVFIPSTRPSMFEKNLGYGTQIATILSSVILVVITVRTSK